MSDAKFVTALRYSAKTIAIADVVESVGLIARDAASATRRIRHLLYKVASDVVVAHGGRMVDERGEGMFVEFPSPAAAVA